MAPTDPAVPNMTGWLPGDVTKPSFEIYERSFISFRWEGKGGLKETVINLY